MVWKVKYVELSHGLLTYADDVHWNQKQKKKNIILAIDNCRCRALDTVASKGQYLFEISSITGPARLWTCSSEAERDAWMQAIYSATLGT